MFKHMFSRRKDPPPPDATMPVIGVGATAANQRPPVPPKRTSTDRVNVPPAVAPKPARRLVEEKPIHNNNHNGFASKQHNGSDAIFAARPFTIGDGARVTFDSGFDSSSEAPPTPFRAFQSPKDFNIQGLALPALAAVQVNVRRLKIQKNVTGDFGFSIRRVQFPVGRRGELKAVVFAEPSEVRHGPPRPDDIKNGLLPGDQLVEINGLRVDSMSREQLQDAIRNAGSTIELLVKAVPELAEFCDRRRGVRDAGDQLMLTQIDTTMQEDIREDERYWLMHKNGYTCCRLLQRTEDGHMRIVVAGREMTVDSTDVDRCNPAQMDRVPDIASLRYLNETSIVHLLRQRFGSSLQFTNAGSQSVVCVASLDSEPMAQERLVSLFKGCRRGQMPAHIFATAQQVYRNVQMSAQNQAIVLTGVAGSGKSTQLRNLVRYLSSAAGWTKSLPYERLAMALGVLEAFGNAATSLHKDSTRHVQMFALGFDKVAALRGARIQACMLEADRIVRRPPGEASFHVFYYLWEGANETLRKRLQLDTIHDPSIEPFRRDEDKQSAAEAWERLLAALDSLGFSAEAVHAITSVLGAVFHLVAAGATPGAASRSQFLRAGHAQSAAALLAVTPEELAQAVFRGRTATTSSVLQTTSGSGMNRFALTSRGADGPEALAAFVSGLYNELFTVIVENINKALNSNACSTYITVLDFPGSSFHSDWVENKPKALGLNDLVYNYVNERVAELFYDASFTQPQEVYSREQVDVTVELPLASPHPLNRLMDQKQQLLACTDIDRRSEERRGLLAILEEESMFPGATDDSLFERIFVHLDDESRLIHRGVRPRQFVLAHGMNCHPTVYGVEGWVKAAQPCESASAARPLICGSKSPQLSSFFALSAMASETAMSKLRRATQAAQLELLSSRRSTGFFANINAQVDYVFSSLRRSPRTHFVHCVQPTAAMRTTTDIVDVPYVRSQLRTILMIDSVRANNRGYPERVSFRDFRRRFGCLADDEVTVSIEDALDDRGAVAKILERMDIHQHRYRLGISQVLLASDVLCELEDRRELSLSGLVVAFQRECRRHLAAKWIAKRRILETAIQCIQKNGRSYMRVREWPWWRLYTKVVPLLAVAKTDSDHREWVDRIRSLEQRLADMRVEKTKADGRAAELEQALTRETQMAHELSTALDNETQTRVQLERRLQQWRDGVTDEDRISRVSSVARMEATPEVSELKNEIGRLRSSEETLKVKAQKAVVQLQDVESELATVRARNETLEKKQQRFDSDLRSVEDNAREAQALRIKAEKDRDEQQLMASRKTAELQDLRTENAELRATASRLRREADERAEVGSYSGSSGVGSDVGTLQKARRDLEAKMRDQEDEMNELAGQNQLLQQTVTRLEMSSERLKADLSREAAAREAEVEELRGQYQRRLRALEDQLADLQDTNASLVKQNRMLGSRTTDFSTGQMYEFTGGHYRRELRNALALLADTQALLQHEREQAPSQGLLRQLREQLEDSEATKLSALKGKHSLESELNEVRTQLEQALAAKSAAEDRALHVMKEKNSCLALIVEKDEQLQSLLKKYKAAVQQNQLDHIAIADYMEQISDLEKAKQKISEQWQEQTTQLEFVKQHSVDKHKLALAEQKIRDLEARLDLEQAHKTRHESIVIKQSDEIDNLQTQLSEASSIRDKESENARRARKELTHLQEQIEELKKRDTESIHKLRASRAEIEKLEEHNKVLLAEQKLSQRRIESLQSALNDGIGDDVDEEDENEIEREDDGRGTGMHIL